MPTQYFEKYTNVKFENKNLLNKLQWI
jgi:hypothetical protein